MSTISNKVTPLEEYLFDLNGYIILRNVIDAHQLASANAIVDSCPKDLKTGEWWGNVQVQSYSETDGINLQQIYEAGKPFEELIDQPGWIEKVKHFVGGEGTFDWLHGPLFLDENFFSIRGPGQAIGLHSGGETGTKRTQFRYHNGHFQCGQINILMAFNDIGPGDGATMVIPGSHKANFPHPSFEEHKMKHGETKSVEGVEGAIEVYLNAGDAILFVDAISHGSAARVNDGERRICVYRYGPSWGYFRHGYRPSEALLDRLAPEKRKMVHPHEAALLPPQ
ncbi:phytanoyl-CoA dioxygenase family protein [Rubellicoccus peritrichatus]|uniref:Phytanoyl-CoA dioxygenase family protein n=1 Tax=Rubellicoccus peritrichatus TaxID=3080537 RepID=A0AAQ3QUQ7_9BACT|nr:phytanoyl-CoA dioxygenase family protein [Puniceicoccus sp. CR14]WOO40022.1 phytanoyl-CoA dioxygenase family protein [Puniceicoccus sp. CR14]